VGAGEEEKEEGDYGVTVFSGLSLAVATF